MRIERVPLPGIGTRLRFATTSGTWVGVIQHTYAASDSDTVQTSVRLTEQEAHELSEILYSHHNGEE